MKQVKIVVLPGDGIGPEVTSQAVRVLKVVGDYLEAQNTHQFQFIEKKFGGAAIDAYNDPFPKDTKEAILNCDAILLGAVGGPQWPKLIDVNDQSKGYGPRPEQGLLDLRKLLDLYANIRPVFFPSQSLIDNSPLKPEIVQGTEFIVIRELVGGVYFGDRKEGDEDGKALDTMPYSKEEIYRIAKLAGDMAMKSEPPLKIHSIDKANVLATSRLWRKVVTETIEKEYPKIVLDHHLVDSAAMLMIQKPTALNGIVLTENMFGDILSDEASVIPGSLGLMPSASLNGLPNENSSAIGLYEPIHGSAPDIAGKNIANPIGTILSAAMLLKYSLSLTKEADHIERAVRKVLDLKTQGGIGLRTKDLKGEATTNQIGDKIVEYLNNSLISGRISPIPRSLKNRLLTRPNGRRGMNLCEKILCNAAIGLEAPGNIRPGDMICVNVDWTLASELTWKGMNKTYEEMGRPSIHRNDRFWLAIDHTVDPRINHLPKPKELIQSSESFAKEAGLIDFHGPNQTILHTEFYRQRAQPGMVICGADSHSCSAGGLGAFAVGLGAADVVMPLVTGETWFKVPEVVEIKFVNQPPFGIGGKDAILYVLGELKRNTVAFERAVEFTGPGLKYLSCDARFAIANMTTEFGGIAGVFEADEITAAYIAKRKLPQHKNSAIYFRKDEDAEYAASYEIDLSKVDSLVALYPSPDNVVSVEKASDTKLDGVFIGACTTAEEDLILAALVLEEGLKKGMVPVVGAKRRVTPGSVQIVAKLRKLNLLEIYEKCGFEIGAPGCSYCIAVAADKADEGEVWLSSQNRNFKNRMGKGSIGNLASAATVAASSFEMKITDPRPFLDTIDRERYEQMLEIWLAKGEPIVLSEPNPVYIGKHDHGVDGTGATTQSSVQEDSNETEESSFQGVIKGKAQVFGDHVDTDAIIPAQFMPGINDADLGTHAFQYVKPDFVEKANQGFDIVVGGVGFGSGSSREEAPRALKGAGIKAVIAKSFAFIYSRNQPNMALLGITLPDEKFYELVSEGSEIAIDVTKRTIYVGDHQFKFQLSTMEENLMAGGGVSEMYSKFGSKLFRVAMGEENPKKHNKTKSKTKECPSAADNEVLAW
ncbi:3-isopropylmalate dehydrogenase [Neoconidiobolus thromboides FSU 785]|nr:3-isopropylmalate dehydrogenase [Neoconidiobolus thromboides FSU 785]